MKTEPNYPKPSGMWRKHIFGETESGVQRYMTSTVIKFPAMVEAKWFGTEHEQLRMECKTIQEGCAEMDGVFREMFPDHVCCTECLMIWHRWPDEVGFSQKISVQ